MGIDPYISVFPFETETPIPAHTLIQGECAHSLALQKFNCEHNASD